MILTMDGEGKEIIKVNLKFVDNRRGYPCETPNPVKRRIYPNFQKTPLFTSTMNNSLNSTPMKLAIADLELQDKPNILATAKKYNVVESTLRRR